MEQILTNLFLLIAVHALTDFSALQGSEMVKWKSPLNKPKDSDIKRYQQFIPFWIHWMTAHSFINALGVYVVTRNIYLSLMEIIIHWIIDYSKCKGWIKLDTDQGLHLLSKLLYVRILI